MDPTVPERNRFMPTLKHSHPYNKLWAMGQDDMAILNKYSQTSPERNQTLPRSDTSSPHKDIALLLVEKKGLSSSSQSITIPRPQGRKTPELGIVPPPPPPRPSKLQNAPALTDPVKIQFAENISLPVKTTAGLFGEVAKEDEHKQVDSMSMDLLQPVKISSDICLNDDILSLLDPLKRDQRHGDDLPSIAGHIQSSEAPHCSGTPCFMPGPSENAQAVFPYQLGFSTPQPSFIHSPLNPFIQTVPADQSVSVIGITARPFSPSVVSNPLFTRSMFYHSQRCPTPGFTGSGLLSQVLSTSPGNPIMQQSQSALDKTHNVPPTISGPRGHSTFPVIEPLSDLHDGKHREYPAIPSRPSKLPDPVLFPSKPGQPRDPFEEIISETKPAVTPPPCKVEQLRKRWETFE